MRYPEGKSDSLNNSDTQSIRYPSSSTTSQEADPNDTSPNNNIATVSEHVLFGNNNGQNSFLYLYYSSSNPSNNHYLNTRRPYTTGGAGEGENSKMGSKGGQQWNDLSGLRSSLGSAGPSPLSNTNEDVDEDDEKTKSTTQMESSGNPEPLLKSGAAPYPVYISPLEGSPASSTAKSKSQSQPMKKSTRQVRLDSFTVDLLDDEDWDRIYSVPTVDSRYILSPEPPSKSRSGYGSPSPENTGQGSSKQIHNNLSVSKFSIASSSSSSSGARLVRSRSPYKNSGSFKNSSKKARVTPGSSYNGGGGGHNSSTKKLSSRSSTISNKKFSPASSTKSNSIKITQQNHTNHGVTHHHHRPPSPNTTGKPKRVTSTTTGDGLDQMSFNNGIGAWFGTPASRQISQKRELTPEEMYRQEMQGWRSRLATAATIFAATLFIMSCSSLLFVFPILVDPILVGFEAQFPNEPVVCRTTNFRNGTGSAECAIPSCREGCTLDLFSCIFVEVEYTIPQQIDSALSIPAPHTDSYEDHNGSSLSPQDFKKHATLYININGCGYPPDVTCSDFERKYASLNTEFPCYYSQQNTSIVVPHYSRRTEIIHLALAISIPIGVAIMSGIALYLLLRYQTTLKASIYRKYAARRRALKEHESDVEEDDTTSISELDQDFDIAGSRNHKVMQNGASKNGVEANSTLLTSTQM